MARRAGAGNEADVDIGLLLEAAGELLGPGSGAAIGWAAVTRGFTTTGYTIQAGLPATDPTNPCLRVLTSLLTLATAGRWARWARCSLAHRALCCSPPPQLLHPRPSRLALLPGPVSKPPILLTALLR